MSATLHTSTSLPGAASPSILSRRWKVFLVTFSVAAPIAILSLFSEVFLILVISVAITMILNPLVDLLERKGVPRAASILGMYVIAGTLIAAGLMNLYSTLIHQAEGFSSSLDDQHITALFSQLAAALSKQIPSLKPEEITSKLNAALPELAAKAESSLEGALNIVGSLIIVPFITFFLLNDYHKIQKGLISNLPNKYFEMSLKVIYKLERQLS